MTDLDDRIASTKKPGVRGRSGSPATFSGPQQASQQQQSFNPSSFGFAFGSGGPPQQQQQQNGTSSFQFGVDTPAPSFGSFGASTPTPATNMQPNGNPFGAQTPSAAPTFSSSFTAGAAPAQQNGFNPSTTSAFGQSSQTPSFGGFGQTPQQNAFGEQKQQAPNGGSIFNFGSQQQQENKPSTPFAGFGQTQQEKDKPSTPFAGFGGAQADKDKPSNPFASFQKPADNGEKANTSSIFSQKPQENADKPSNPFAGFGQQPTSTSEKANTPGPIFGQKPQENGEKPSNPFANFGQKTQEKESTPSNPFANFGQKPEEKKEDTPSNPFSNFGQKPAETSDKPNTLFGQKPVENGTTTLFGQQDAQKDKGAEQPTPKLGFSFGQQNGEKSGGSQTPKPLFGQSQSQATPQTEKPRLGGPLFSQSTQPTNQTSNIFSQQGSQSTQASSNPFGSMSKSQPADSEKKPGLFGSSGLTPSVDKASSGSIFSNLPKKDLSNGGKPLFSSADPSQVYQGEDDADEGEEQQEDPAPKPTGSFFNFSSQSQASTQDAGMATPKASHSVSGSQTQGRSLFDRIDKDDMAKRMSGPTPSENSDETPKAGSFGQMPQTPATIKPLFQPSAPSATPTAPSLFQPAVSETPKGSPPKSIFTKPATPAPMAPPPAKFSAPPTSPVNRTAPPPQSAPVSATSTGNLSAQQVKKLKGLNSGLMDHLKRADLTQDWTAVMQYYMRMAATITSSSAPPEATDSTIVAPAAAPAATPISNIMFSQTARPAQTPQQPTGGNLFSQPPNTAPAGAKKRPFDEQDNDDSAQPPATEKRSKPNETVNYPKLPQTSSSTSKLFADVLDKKDAAAPSGFKPSTSMFSASKSAAPSTPAPATGGFSMPVFTAPAGGSTNFLSSFGQKAKAQEAEDRKKRKAEDYDSDEETEEQWEKRDREEQAAKRKKLEEAAKEAKGFTLSTPSASNGVLKTPFKLGTSSSAAAGTPATQPPKFSGLFGANTQTPATAPAGEAGKLAPPTGFSFGAPKTSSLNSSLAASRATTPGVTTDGETSNAGDESKTDGDGDGEPSDSVHEEVTDMTKLQKSELEANDVLLEMPEVSTKLYTKKADEAKASWKPIQTGRMYVLKDKSNGSTHVLAKVGMGRSALNYKVVQGMKYNSHPKKESMIVATFMDHIYSSPAKLERFYITCADADQAKELMRVLNEGAK